MEVEPLRIEVVDGAGVRIEWDDGTANLVGARELRRSCMCAGCREPAGEAATAAVLAGPEPVAIAGASLVGGYALNLVFAPDGHRTGIFPYTALRDMGSPD